MSYKFSHKFPVPNRIQDEITKHKYKVMRISIGNRLRSSYAIILKLKHGKSKRV